MEVQGSDASFKLTTLASSLHRYYSYYRKEAGQLELYNVMLSPSMESWLNFSWAACQIPSVNASMPVCDLLKSAT